ncbi:MAG: hypothetical protein GX099_03555, partial [Clostridiaceae bacterium]|nr:hypothetical protein [Clostridiaceae bacterium]
MNSKVWKQKMRSVVVLSILLAFFAGMLCPIAEVQAQTMYKLSYVLNGGSGKFPTMSYYPNSTGQVSTTKPTRSSYKFNYWKCSDGKTYSPGASIKMTGNKTLTANWTWSPTPTPTPRPTSTPIPTPTPPPISQPLYFTYAGGLTNGSPSHTGQIYSPYVFSYSGAPDWVHVNRSGNEGYTVSCGLNYGGSRSVTITVYASPYTYIYSITQNAAPTPTPTPRPTNTPTPRPTWTLTYYNNGGSGGPGAVSVVHGTRLYISATKPTKSGHTFL